MDGPLLLLAGRQLCEKVSDVKDFMHAVHMKLMSVVKITVQ